MTHARRQKGYNVLVHAPLGLLSFNIFCHISSLIVCLIYFPNVAKLGPVWVSSRFSRLSIARKKSSLFVGGVE